MLGASNSQAAVGAPDPAPRQPLGRGILGAQSSMPRMPGTC
jgi:hypothetical protein